jgi:DNA transformation protein and related proteins
VVQCVVASKQQNVHFVLEQIHLDELSVRKMFGEYAIYVSNKVVALFCDDQLFIKSTDAGRAFIGKVTEAAPYPGAKPWCLISGDRCEDAEWLTELINLTARALPSSRKKAAKEPKKSATRTSVRGRAATTAKRPLVDDSSARSQSRRTKSKPH